jgi:hypothetical protein
VNEFVREGLVQLPIDQRLAAAEQISRTYYRLLKNELKLKVGPDRNGRHNRRGESYKVREQAIYYAGRLALPQCPQVLVDAYVKDPDPVLRRAAALGAILHRDYRVERDYLDRIERNERDAILNRSIELVYRGDVEDSIYIFRDDGEHSWARTRQSILTRLTSSTPRDAALRWWDLVTLKSFLISRRASTLTSDEWKVVEKTNCSFSEAPAQRTASASKAKKEILKLRTSARRLQLARSPAS